MVTIDVHWSGLMLLTTYFTVANVPGLVSLCNGGNKYKRASPKLLSGHVEG